MSGAAPFLWPAALPWLLLVPAFAAVLVATERRAARRLAEVVGPRSGALAPVDARARAWRRRLLGAGLLCALLALAQPTWGAERVVVAARGADVVVALDVSRSMLAGDVAPSRLEAARAAIAEATRRAPGDRFALVVFAGEARCLVPLTSDLDSFRELLAGAEPESVARGGTDLGAALDGALALAPADGERNATILLVTDGEDLEGRGAAAAGRCRERGVVVDAIGVGSPLGSKIVVRDGGGAAFLKDGAGREVVSSLDMPGLTRIATVTGGRAFEAGTDASALLAGLERHRGGDGGAGEDVAATGRSEPANRFQWPLALALLCWLLERLVRERRR
jgi:Ca-activated chloride channel family protein